MRKIVALCFLISSVFIIYAQSFGNFSGSLTGSGVTAAAASAAKQLQALNAGNPTATSNLSQLQLLGLDPTAVQKYLKAKSDEASKADNNTPGDMLQTILEMKAKQDAMSEFIDKAQQKNEPNNNVTPNEIFGHDFFGTGKLALFSKSSEAKAPDSYILGVGDEISIAVWGYADYNNKFKVNEDGFIQIPEFGRIYVKGLSFGAVKAQIVAVCVAT